MEKRSQQDRGNPKREHKIDHETKRKERLNRKYRLEEKGALYVSVILKQKIKARR